MDRRSSACAPAGAKNITAADNAILANAYDKATADLVKAGRDLTGMERLADRIPAKKDEIARLKAAAEKVLAALTEAGAGK